MIQVLDAQFVTTAVAPEQYPKGDLPEVAFVGRSNVGKSSMINALAGRRKLVRVSNTPGRTRTLNFFDVQLAKDTERYRVRVADLPGYGFAKASKAERAAWKEMISTYLEKRRSLQVVVSIIDAEVGPQPDDFRTLDYLAAKARRILVVATKIDRLPKAKRKPRLQALAARLELPLASVLPFSATERLGVDEVWETLLPALGAG
ncbi:MAG: ribosome biogenesis GTP-binding protein YihA/YsxC [Myxococcota bacterium]